MTVEEGSVAHHEKFWGTSKVFKSGDKKKLFDMSCPKYIADEPKTVYWVLLQIRDGFLSQIASCARFSC